MGDILLVMQNKNRKCVSHMSKSMPRLEGKYKNVHLPQIYMKFKSLFLQVTHTNSILCSITSSSL